MASTTPAWMEGFEEEEEWVSDGSSLSASASPATATATSIPNWAGSGSISYATPRKQPQSHSRRSMLLDEEDGDEDEREESPMGGGTFLIRDDQPLPDTPLGLKPGQMQIKRGGAKTIFSPLPLERLFDPPSPPAGHPPTSNQAQASSRSTTPPLPPPKPVFSPVATTKPGPGGPRRSKLSQSHLPPPTSPETVKGNAHGNVDGDSIEASDIPGLVGFDGRKQSSTFQFTFIVPRTHIPLRIDANLSRTHVSPPNPSPNPRANETPNSIWRYEDKEEQEEEDQKEPTANEEQEQEQGQGGTPMVDTRLKLFHLQYDTYTRDHLGALADSIAVKASSPQHDESSVDEEPVWRSTKRIKLSPKDDISSLDTSYRTSSSGDFHQSPWGKVQTRSFFQGTTSSMSPSKIAKDDWRLASGGITSQETSVSFQEVVYAEYSPPKNPNALNDGRPRRHPSGSSTTTVTEPAINTLPQTIAKRAAVNYRLQGANILAQIKKDVDLARSDGPHSIVVEEQSSAGSFSLSSADVTRDQQAQDECQPGQVEENEEDFRSSKSATSRPKRTTPRKLLRRISAADEVDKEVLFSGNTSLVDSPARVSRKRSPDTRNSPVKPAHEVSFRVLPTIVFTSMMPGTHAMPQLSNHPVISNTPMLPSRQPSTAPMTLHPKHYIPASHDDMNRFVSSSTLASGISGTTAGSFVKHAGPPKLRTIRPEELHGVLGAKVGGMTYSTERQIWVKVKEVEGEAEGDAGTTSDDPFGDIESLEATPRSARFLQSINGGGGDGSNTSAERSFVVNSLPQRRLRDEDVVQNEEDIVTEDEADGRPVPPPPQINPNLQFDSDSTASTNLDEQPEAMHDDLYDASVVRDSSQQQPNNVQDTPTRPIARSLEELSEGIANISLQMDMSPPRPARPTKIRTSFSTTTTPKPIRAIPSASAPSSSRPQIFPRSVLKQPTPQKPLTPRRHTDPADFSHRRSVSFSDGRKAGKIRGLASPSGETEDTATATELSRRTEMEAEDDEQDDEAHDHGASSYVPSARAKRIGNLLEGLEGSEDGSGALSTFVMRSREGSRSQPSPQKNADPSQLSSASDTEEHQEYYDLPEQQQDQSQQPDESIRDCCRPTRTQAGRRAEDATFLTEASFRVTHDQLIRVLTSVQPYEPYWEELTSIDLSRKGLDSLTRLKEFLPSLERLSVEENHLTWLTGVPCTLRGLFAANNMLTSVTSYTHLPNLEELDISHGQVESLQQLECLRHLRELKVDGNRVTRLDGITRLECLTKASIRGNALGGVLDIAGARWPRMETLDLSENRLTDVRGIGRLKALISLNLDNNELEAFNTPTLATKTTSPASPVIFNSKLRVLRLSGNRLTRIELGSDPSVPSSSSSSWCAFPGLRTLYADDNRLGEVVWLEGLTRLENLSLREQRRSDGIVLSGRSIRDIKRLYLSGNALPAHLFVSSSPLYNLVYLELASCKLTSLPPNLASCVPNLRVLNLNYNFLTGEDIIRGLTTALSSGGLRRLRKLTVVGGRVKSWRGVVGKLLKGLGELEVLDFRMNPFSLGWYFPLLVNASDLLSAVQPTSHLSQQSQTSPSASPTRDSVSRKPRRKSPYAPTWMELDERFRRDLPDAVYMDRLAYRGLVMRACDAGGPGGKLKMLDGVEVTDGEREKAGKLLSGLEKAAAARAQAAAAGTSSSPVKEKWNKNKVRSAAADS